MFTAFLSHVHVSFPLILVSSLSQNQNLQHSHSSYIIILHALPSHHHSFIMSSCCQVVWIIHEARSRLINPFVSQLRRLGYHSDVHFLEQSQEEFLDKFTSDTYTLVVFYSYEDFMYAKNVWSWETQESKPSTRVTTLADIFGYQHDHTSFCCIHDHDNIEKIDVPADLMASLTPLCVVPDEAGVVQHVTQHFQPQEHQQKSEQQQQQQQQQSEESEASSSPSPSQLLQRSVVSLPLVPLAARVVIIRHAQRWVGI